MKILVSGGGQVGSGIARQLAGEGHDVTIVDIDEELVAHLSEHYDVHAIHGHGSHPHILEAAGARDADLLIAVTQSDEVNMVACQVAEAIFKVPMKIARIRNQHYLDPAWSDLYSKNNMHIDVTISPEIEVAKAILRRLHLPGALDMVPFADGKVRMVALKCLLDCPMLGFSQAELLAKAFDNEIQVNMLGVVRDHEFLLAPNIQALRANDDVYLVAPEEDVRRVMTLFGHEEKEAHRVVILGGGNIGLFLAQQLEKGDQGIRARIVEAGQERAEYIADRLERTTVIHGSAMDQEILLEAAVNTAETVIAVTNDDKVNILASLLAKREGCARAITLVNNLAYTTLVSTLGIDAVVSPRETTASSILQQVRRGRIRGLHSIRDGAAEVLEAEVVDSAPVAGKTVREIDLPKGVYFAALLRDGLFRIPEADTVIQPQDRLVMVCMAAQVKRVERVFSMRMEYL